MDSRSPAQAGTAGAQLSDGSMASDGQAKNATTPASPSKPDPVQAVKADTAAPAKRQKKKLVGLDLSWEKRLWAKGFPCVAGIDEAGRGPLAGPVRPSHYAVVHVAELPPAIFNAATLLCAAAEPIGSRPLWVGCSVPGFGNHPAKWQQVKASSCAGGRGGMCCTGGNHRGGPH